MKRLVLCLLLVMGSNSFLQAQWVKASGPYSGYIRCFAENKKFLFAGSTDGIYLSTNNGITWTTASNGLTTKYIQALTISGSNIFAGTLGGGVFTSSNNGANWTAVNNGLDQISICSFAVIDSNIFAGSGFGNVYFSTNNGRQWNAVKGWDIKWAGFGSTFLTSIGRNLFAATNTGIYLSTDSGNSWSNINNSIPLLRSLSFLSAIGTTLYGGTFYGLFISADSGKTWQHTLKDIHVNAILRTGSHLFAAFGAYLETSGIYCITDDDTNWNLISNGIPKNNNVFSLASSNNNIIAGTSNGAFISIDNGANWSLIKDELDKEEIFCTAVMGMNLFAGTNNGVYLSTDRGTSWSTVNYGLCNTRINCLSGKNTNLFAGTEGGGIFVSTNNGAAWTPINKGLLNAYVKTIFIKGNYIYAGTKGGVYLSVDNGMNWSAINNGLTNLEVKTITGNTDQAGVTNIFVGTSSGVYLSKNQGVNWVEINNGLSNADVNTLLVQYRGSLVVLAGTNGSGIFSSANNGNNWTQLTNELRQQKIKCFADSSVTSYIYAGTEGNGMYVRGSSGWSFWGLAGSNVNSITGMNFYTGKATLFAGTNDGIWVNLYPIPVGIEKEKILPSDVELSQNYPNPFNPSTTIKYTIPVETRHASSLQHVSLKVFDLLGREVATLVDEVKQPGNYEITFNVETRHGASLPSGVYFYTLRAGEYVSTKKMVLMK